MPYLSSQLPNAIAWTLIHSLWQGLLAVALYIGCRRMTRVASVRHAVGHLCLALFLLSQLVTIAFEADAAHTLSDALTRATIVDQPLAPRGFSLMRPLPTSSMPGWIGTLNPVLPWLAACWVLGLAAQMVWMLLTIAALRREVRRSMDVGAPWKARFQDLIARIPGAGVIRFVETAAISVPGTAGWWTPVIFVPIGWAAQMPPQQVEAIILHEIAHVARRDWISSLLRSFLRAVYFFHLPVRWMIHALEDDAEEAADDLAAHALGDRRAYATALLDLEERRASIQLALGADGGSLKARFNHLIATRQSTSRAFSRVTGTLLAGCLALLLLGYGAAGAATDYAESAWLESHDTTSAVVEILSRNEKNPAADALIYQCLTTPDASPDLLLSLARELQHGVEADRFLTAYRTIPFDAPLTTTVVPGFGTALDRRRLVNSMVALAKSSSGADQRDAARAAFVLAALDIVDGEGARVGLLIGDPPMRSMLRLTAAATARLERVKTMQNTRTGELLKLLPPVNEKLGAAPESLPRLKYLLQRLPGMERMIAKGHNMVLREQLGLK